MVKVFICYYSKSGNTKRMAEEIAKGASIDGCEVKLKSVSAATPEDMLASDAVIIGSPTYYGTMAHEVKKLLDESVKYHGKMTGKIGGAFTSSGMLGGGNETTVLSILQGLLIHGMVVVGNARIAHYGPVAVRKPDEKALEECKEYGKRIAELTLALGG